MDSYKQMINQQIEDLISSINFKKDFDLSLLKEQITQLTGAIPSVTVDWKKELSVNENSKEELIIETVKGIKIVWLDTDGKPNQQSFII